MTQYQVITSDDRGGLELGVIAALRDGWICQGGVSISRNAVTGVTILAQAMVK